MKIAIVVAMGLDGVIGNQGKIPWAGRLPADMEHFIEITSGHWVIMGRKTWESIPSQYRPLANRKNVVLSRRPLPPNWLGKFCEPTSIAELVLYRYKEAVPFILVANDLHEVLKDIEMIDPMAQVFVIGGAEVYAQALPLAGRIFCTLVYGTFPGDTVFPTAEKELIADWERIDFTPGKTDEKNKFDYAFQVFIRKDGMPGGRVVDPDNARNAQYRQELWQIQASGKCPFCPGGYTLTNREERDMILHDTKYWRIKRNSHPMKDAELHFTLILKRHVVRIGELTDKESADIVNCVDWITASFPEVVGGVLTMRDGDTRLTGATVRHLHAHYFKPFQDKAVVMRFGPPPEPPRED